MLNLTGDIHGKKKKKSPPELMSETVTVSMSKAKYPVLTAGTSDGDSKRLFLCLSGGMGCPRQHRLALNCYVAKDDLKNDPSASAL